MKHIKVKINKIFKVKSVQLFMYEIINNKASSSIVKHISIGTQFIRTQISNL